MFPVGSALSTETLGSGLVYLLVVAIVAGSAFASSARPA